METSAIAIASRDPRGNTSVDTLMSLMSQELTCDHWETTAFFLFSLDIVPFCLSKIMVLFDLLLLYITFFFTITAFSDPHLPTEFNLPVSQISN